MASRVWNESSCTNARILEAQVIGYEVVKRRWPVRKVYEFIIDASWSYGGRTITRRSYDDFVGLQTSILDRFPDEARPATRIIPWLPGRKLLTPNSKKLADERLPDLDDYVKRLIQLPQRISESDMVLTFFEPEADDHTDESTILPTANRECLEDKSTESEQGDNKDSKKRPSQTKKGPRRGSSGRKDGFINHVDDDDAAEEEGEDFDAEVHSNIQPIKVTLEHEDDNTSKKRSSKTRKGSRRNSSRNDGFMNYENEDDTDDVDEESDDVYRNLAPRDALTKRELNV